MEHNNTEDSHLTMMDQRPWAQQTNHGLPKRFRDELLQPSPPLVEVQITGIAPPPPPETIQDIGSRSDSMCFHICEEHIWALLPVSVGMSPNIRPR